MHGYSHENPIAMTPEQEEAVLVKCIGLIEEVSGKRPTGYVAPWWEFSNVTNELLLKHGIKYDHSLMHRDFRPVLRPRRRLVDEDRLLEAARRVDAAARARRGDGPDRDPGELAPGRPAADDVHQGSAEQPRLRQPPASRGAVARPVRLRLPRGGLRGLRHDRPPGCRGAPAGDPHAGAPDRAHLRARRRSVGRRWTRSPTTSRSAIRGAARRGPSRRTSTPSRPDDDGRAAGLPAARSASRLYPPGGPHRVRRPYEKRLL